MVIPTTQSDSFYSLGNKEAKQMLVFTLIKNKKGATLFELVEYLTWPINRISGRVRELVKDGFVMDSGQIRINPESGKGGIVWVEIKAT